MFIKLIEVTKGIAPGRSSIREVYVNPQHIISVSEDPTLNQTLLAEIENLGLVHQTVFSKIIIQEGAGSRNMIVVGAPAEIYTKINKKQILRG